MQNSEYRSQKINNNQDNSFREFKNLSGTFRILIPAFSQYELITNRLNNHKTNFQVKNIYILLLAVILLSVEARSQSYVNALGLRMGTCGGLSYRKIVDNDLAGELQLTGYHHSTIITFLVEKHRPMLIRDHFPLTLFYGAGVHAGFGSAHYYGDWPGNDHYDNDRYYGFSPKAGIDGFAALEYEFDRFPVSLSLECKPFIEFFDYGFPGLHIPAVAVAVRYTF
jgi:hypothetical protein